MADDSDNTKAAFERNWGSATEAGEYLTQSDNGAWCLAPVDIRTALLGGCRAVLELDQGGQKSYAFPPKPKEFWFPPDRLRWVNTLDPSMRREDYPDRSWPWELRAYLSPSESLELRDSEGLPLARPPVITLRVFLHLADAVQWGLLPASTSPQTVANEEPPLPVGSQTPTHAQSASEQPEAPPPAPARATLEPAQAPPDAKPSQSPQAQRQPGGRPTDRVMMLEEAARRLRQPGRTKATSLVAFACELRKWLQLHGEHRAKKTGEVMQVRTIKDHVRPLWNSRSTVVEQA
jgi:hypothetical protein